MVGPAGFALAAMGNRGRASGRMFVDYHGLCVCEWHMSTWEQGNLACGGHLVF